MTITDFNAVAHDIKRAKAIPHSDKFELIANAIMYDLCDRAGIKNVIRDIEEESPSVVRQMKEHWANVAKEIINSQ